jgi:hypothetical protein
VLVCRFGFWNRTETHELYDGGTIGASLFEDKLGTGRAHEPARFVRATDWFRENLDAPDATHRQRIQNWLRVAGAVEPGGRVRQLAWVVEEAAKGRREPLRAALRPR